MIAAGTVPDGRRPLGSGLAWLLAAFALLAAIAVATVLYQRAVVQREVEQARKIAALGATEVEMADFFGVTTVTLFNWRTQHPEFFNATRLGKEEADDRVEQRLFARAMGYEHDEVDIRVVNGEIVKTPIRKFYPPDTAAASLWLRNRRPGAWRDKVEAIHTGADGGPIQARIAVEFVKPAPRAEDD